jgi:hypothetical protein
LMAGRAERTVPLLAAFGTATAAALLLPLKKDPKVPVIEDWFDATGAKVVTRGVVWIAIFLIALLLISVGWRYATSGTPSQFKIWVLVELGWSKGTP